jgi:ABC-2 type transport system ATP-binding protein
LLGLLGPNGCGKSTTLRVLTGLLIPQAGELYLRGERVSPGDRKLRAIMGVVFQSPSLDPRLSLRENLTLAARLYGFAPREVHARVASALAFAELDSRADAMVSELSGGMKRRLELARALLHDPRLLLLDEPTTGLDEPSFQRAWERIFQLRSQLGTSVIVATHRAQEAALCDRVAVLDQGRLVACDTPQALIDRVAGDVLTLEADDPVALAAEIRKQFGLEPRVVGDTVVVERERGHELVPRLVEALPPGRIRALSMHRPDLSDVFLKLTGRALGETGRQP